jgi:hypothetical protein
MAISYRVMEMLTIIGRITAIYLPIKTENRWWNTLEISDYPSSFYSTPRFSADKIVRNDFYTVLAGSEGGEDRNSRIIHPLPLPFWPSALIRTTNHQTTYPAVAYRLERCEQISPKWARLA